MAETIYDVAVIGAGTRRGASRGLSEPPDATRLGPPLRKSEL